MNPKLRALLLVVGAVALGGVGFQVLTPKDGVKLADLRDAGVAEGQRFVLECDERISPRIRNRIENNQPGTLRPRQKYVRVARVAVCFNADGGNCFRAADGTLRVGPNAGSVVVPGLSRRDPDADDSEAVDAHNCTYTVCSRATADAGFTNPYGDGFCSDVNRLAVQPPKCAVPDVRQPDGGWCEDCVVDCRFNGPYGNADGGARWRGVNVLPARYAVGTQCLPVACTVFAGDDFREAL